MRPLILLLAAMSFFPDAAAAAEKDDLAFLKDLVETRGWMLGAPTHVELTRDGSTVVFLRSPPRSPVMSLYAMDVASGTVRELLAPGQLLGGGEEKLSAREREQRERKRVTTRGFTTFDLSRDGKLALVLLSGRAYVVPVAGGAAREVAGPDVFGPVLSPDGKHLAFVRADELWVAPVAGGSAKQLTHGATATLTHGQAEFAAEEELGRRQGFWWSPDSKQLVYQETDTSGVERHEGGQPYPRAGTANAKIAFGIIAATGGKTTWIDWDRKAYEYVDAVSWQEGAPLTMTLRSRDQKELSLVAVEPRTGKTHELVHEHDDAFIVQRRHAARWLRDGSAFIWSTDRRGNWQLELRGRDGALQRELTRADWGAVLLLEVNGKAAFVTRAVEPMDRQVWRVPLDGGEPTALTQGPDEHTGTFAEDAEVWVRATLPRQGQQRLEVLRGDGARAGDLPSVAEKLPFDTNLEVVKLGDFWTGIVRPHNFDPKRKYPVIVDVYGGPTTTVVKSAGADYVDLQWMADHGFIVVRADNRGTPGRGHDWERAMRDGFATVTLDDQVKALQAMAAHEPAMDLGRVGVMGKSFGGYMAALAVLRRPDVFKAGVAVAPVVDWRNYDTAYTERYLGVPPPAGDSKSYDANGLIVYAKDLRRPLLLIHGTADDNVHFSESLLLIDAFFRAGKSELCELLPLVGLTHQLNDPALRIRYWERVFGFLGQHLR